MQNCREAYSALTAHHRYIKYVHTLCDLHWSLSNFAEAGKTLLLHAQLLDWGKPQEGNEPHMIHAGAETRRGKGKARGRQMARQSQMQLEEFHTNSRRRKMPCVVCACHACATLTFLFVQLRVRDSC
jgi:hypothetical protein